MLRHLLERLLYTIPTIWVMVSLIFLLSRILPGTFGEQQILHTEEGFYSKGLQQNRTAAYEQLLHRTNQQLPLFYIGFAPVSSASRQAYSFLIPDFNWHGSNNQYHIWAKNIVSGSLGHSFASSRAVTEVIWEATGNTFAIVLLSLIIALGLALLLGINMVQGKGIKWRRLLLSSLMVLDSFPLFVLCLLLLLFFANPDFFQLFPVFGLSYTLTSNQSGITSFFAQLPYLALPIISLVLVNLPYLTNQFYSSLAGTMHADYIKTARSKGLTPYKVVMNHAFRNAVLPLITVLTDFIPTLVAGAVIIETIFAIPGVGRLLVTSVLARDFPVIVGIVVFIALVKMVSHVIADLLYAAADPRITHTDK